MAFLALLLHASMSTSRYAVGKANAVFACIKERVSRSDTTLVKPLLEYCACIWCPQFKKVVETVSKEGQQIIQALRIKPYNMRFKELIAFIEV